MWINYLVDRTKTFISTTHRIQQRLLVSNGGRVSDFLWQLWLQLILLNNELILSCPCKVSIFPCNSDAQKSYCERTFCRQIDLINQQFAWKVGRGSMSPSQTWEMLDIKYMVPHFWGFCAMLQSSNCISQTRIYNTKTTWITC